MEKTYRDIIQEIDRLDYKDLSKAIFYIVKSYELKEQHKLSEKQTDEVLERTYDFFMESDLGSFIDERLLDKVDEFIDEVLREERDLQDSNQKSKTCKKRRQ
ncbi:Uncharacterised protein [Helicobacter fennelliae]|uniref:Uncharacterized protein n=1 Tax=Helicobacter fennelliae TaxID=215 RepID=A0A2X3E244_9HELI|nr:hypothetical protein [Helicobacter fennelliae]SQC36438.1 Uncharacterised protein [Helicobacter fennelliae]